MLASLVNLMFGCTHRRTSFPISPRSDRGPRPYATYVVCLECGKEFPYSWEEMRIIKPEAADGRTVLSPLLEHLTGK